uniref:VPS10 domain-containing protein n=2 Tax=Eutreptiella gymnastica TaxID=73025 RepID=A0A7S1HXT4_9EUGL|mmetsp:Transcript_113491/g.197109  ORF Transcript_113491/g.197109 Transcript_113491/m.197109 type:complete len:405 (+) Transcript_113491:169-1383(+)
MSRDAGITWRRIKTGRWLYGFADHGGLIVLAAHNLVNVVWYSLDEGKTWTSFPFTGSEQEKVVVKKILYNPHHPTSHSMLLETVTAEGEGRIYRLLFDGMARECQGMTNPSDSSSDYEWWIPRAEKDDAKCFMGSLQKYAVRKVDTVCWDPVGTVREVHLSNCTCTMDDYECDYGYYEGLDTNGEPVCKKDPKYLSSNYQCVDGQVRVTQGYVKTAGNTCDGGLDLDVKWEKCYIPPSSSGLWPMIGMGLLAAAVVAVGFVYRGPIGECVGQIIDFQTTLFRGTGYQAPDQQFSESFDLEDDEDLEGAAGDPGAEAPADEQEQDLRRDLECPPPQQDESSAPTEAPTPTGPSFTPVVPPRATPIAPPRQATQPERLMPQSMPAPHAPPPALGPQADTEDDDYML